MSDLVWEDPPDDGRVTYGKWKAVAQQLRANPGRWAKVDESGTHRGRVALSQRYGMECRFRNGVTYARYVEPADE